MKFTGAFHVDSKQAAEVDRVCVCVCVGAWGGGRGGGGSQARPG